MLSLQLAELAAFRGVAGKLIVGEGRSWNHVRSHMENPQPLDACRRVRSQWNFGVGIFLRLQKTNLRVPHPYLPLARVGILTFRSVRFIPLRGKTNVKNPTLTSNGTTLGWGTLGHVFPYLPSKPDAGLGVTARIKPSP